MTHPTQIFVFGSNLAGRHGKGSAKYAMDAHGAIWGQGIGLQGTSYAIPTKDHNLRVLDLKTIQGHVNDFIKFAYEMQISNVRFAIVDIGCGLAGYKPQDISWMFLSAPSNCFFLGEFGYLLGRRSQ